jgi:hypothetical protein
LTGLSKPEILKYYIIWVISMAKENENIHLFIIEQDYKRGKTKQSDNESFLKGAQVSILSSQNHESVVKELGEMHPSFEANEEPESLQTSEKLGALQTEEGSTDSNLLGLLESFQKMRTEEQKLFEIKQHLLTTQQDLQSRLVKEIDKKKMAIDNLKSEIPDLQNRCKQLGQVLGIDS